MAMYSDDQWDYKTEERLTECGCVLSVLLYRCNCGCEDEWDIKKISIAKHCG